MSSSLPLPPARTHSPPIRVSSPDQLRQLLGEYRGGAASPTPSTSSAASRPSKRDLIRSRHPAPKHVSKLESLGRENRKRRDSKGKGKTNEHEGAEADGNTTTDIGILPEEVYDEYLPPLVARLRRLLIRSLRRESLLLARHQSVVRHPILDRFFVYTSLFGTHSFFLIFLPTAFWIGSPYLGRGLVNTLAFGVYVSSAIKDLLCVPRPYSPPVTRLTIGSVHLEYGFLSTHSTNSVGMALYFYLWVVAMRGQNPQSVGWSSGWWEVGFALYCFSVVYGRIYAGMHSIVDCVTGSLLGMAITMTQWCAFDWIEAFLKIEGWTVPAVLVPACLFMVYVHPQPLDDCPCFEDAIAFISVVQGVNLARWASQRYSLLQFPDLDPFDPLPLNSSSIAPSDTSARNPLIRATLYLLTIIVGVFFIFLTRVLVKTTCKLALPTIYRFFDRTFGLVLPRRHYVPSSEYDEVPLQFNELLRSNSFVDLPNTLTPTVTPAGPWPDVGHPSRRENSSGGLSSGSETSSTAWTSGHDLRYRGVSRDGSSGMLSVPGSSESEYEYDRSGSATPVSRPVSPLSSQGRPPSPLKSTAAAGMSSLTDASQQLAAQKDDQASPNGSSHFIQYAPAPNSSLSVPLTRPAGQGGTELPSDKVANTLAASLSEEERIKQEEAAQQANKSGSTEVKHYDVDVLTKVLVYTAIGFVAAGPLPALFDRLGWTA